jgi:hypothetical protein
VDIICILYTPSREGCARSVCLVHPTFLQKSQEGVVVCAFTLFAVRYLAARLLLISSRYEPAAEEDDPVATEYESATQRGSESAAKRLKALATNPQQKNTNPLQKKNDPVALTSPLQ